MGVSKQAVLWHITHGNIAPVKVCPRVGQCHYDITDEHIRIMRTTKKTGRPKKARVGTARARQILKASGCEKIVSWVDKNGRHLGGTPQDAVEKLRKEGKS